MTTIQPPQAAKPDHVPDELFWDHDYEQFAAQGDDPYLTISQLHDGPDIVWGRSVQFGQGGWLLTRHDHVQEAFLDWEHFSSDYQAMQMLGMDWKLNPLEFDPPQHHLYRKILNPFFTPAKVKELDAPVQQACDALIAEFADRGQCEFIDDFGEKFPSHVFLDLMGMPKDMLPDFLAWERAMLRETDMMKRLEAMHAILNYLQEFVREQRKNPTTDLLRGMVTARYNDERPLNDGELLGMCYLLYIGGLDTVYSVLGWIMRHLATDQPLQRRLRDHPEDRPRAIEEFLRAFAVATPTRRARTDFEFHGVKMKAGDMVKPSTPAAGRDPRAFPNPHQIDIDRNPRHITFATGPHVCLGMHLARREINTVITAFLSRFRNIRIPAGAKCEFHAGGVFGVDHLPLEWDR